MNSAPFLTKLDYLSIKPFKKQQKNAMIRLTMEVAIMKRFNQAMNITIFAYLLFILLGIFLFTRADLANKTIGIFLGIIIILSSGTSLVNYFFNRGYKIFRSSIVFSIIGLLLGFFVLFNPLSATAFLTIGLGILLLIAGLWKLGTASLLAKSKEKYWTRVLFISVIYLIFGIIVIFNPFESNLRITEVIGLFIIAYGILNIVETMLFKRNVKTITKIK